jgi:peptide/nickel transport system substrate-binding protein
VAASGRYDHGRRFHDQLRTGERLIAARPIAALQVLGFIVPLTEVASMAYARSPQRQVLSRRQLLAGVTAAASAALLAACGGGTSATNTPAAKPTTAATTAAAPTTAAPAATTAATSAPATTAAGAASPAAGGASPAASPATTGGTAPTAPATLPGKKGGKLVWALESDPVNLIPYGGVSTSNMWGKEFIYDSLLAWDKDLKVIPALAESYETPDPMTYVFKLRKGVKFHDGKVLDADDVKYSFDVYKDPPPPAAKSLQFNFTSVDVVDANTVKMTLPKPDPTIPGVLAWTRYTPIVPKGAFEKINVSSQAIGTGPYKLVEFVPNDRVVLTRNPDFWRPGLPYLDDITLKVLPDEQSRLAALRSGTIDGGTFSSDTADTVKSDKSLTILTGLVASPKVIQFTIKEAKKPWNDVKVRQAINMTINRQTIIDNVYGGNAELSGPIPPGYGDWPIPASDLASKYYKMDVAGAKKLMADAGFAQGFPVTLQAISAPRAYTQIAEIVREQLKAIGIDVTVQPLEIGTFAKNIGNGDFDWGSTGRGMRGDPSGFVNDFNKGTANYPVWFNGGYDNPELDKLYNDALQTVDQAKRKPMYQRIQEIILTEVPNMYTVQDKKFQIIRNRVKNMYVSFTDFNSGLREAWVEG